MPANAEAEEAGCSGISVQLLQGRDESLGGYNHHSGFFLEPNARYMLAIYFWLDIEMLYFI